MIRVINDSLFISIFVNMLLIFVYIISFNQIVHYSNFWGNLHPASQNIFFKSSANVIIIISSFYFLLFITITIIALLLHLIF
eukprot:gene3984-2839_t